jgi:O-antigen/teichoic acid export membrane protein
MHVGPPRLIPSSIVLNAGAVVAAGLGFVFHLMAARGLGPIGYGVFTASLAYVALWAVVMEGGIGVALTREASADPRRLAWAPRFALWRIRLGLIGVAGAVASAWLLNFDPRVLGLIAIMAVGMVGLSAMRLAFAVFRAVGRFTWEATLSTLQKLVLVPLGAGALLLGTGTGGVAVTLTLSYAIGAVAAVGRAWTAVRPALTSSADAARPPAGFFLWTCVPLLIIDLLSGLYSKVDQVLLLHLRGPEETGLYAAAYRVNEALLLLVGGTMTVMFPRFARSARAAPDVFRTDFIRAWRALWVTGVVFVVNGWLWAVSLLSLFFGSAYAPAQAPLHVLLGALPLIYVNYLLTQSLIATGHEQFYAVGTAVCAGANLGLNLLLIPRWGAMAAAWVTLMTEGMLLIICLLGLRGLGPIIPLRSTLVTGAGAALAVSVGWWALPDRPVERGLFALAVSVAAWEAAAPWPLRRLRARTGPRES